ncbi:putative formate/nitrite transporter [Pluteus cervinus]|uniref:Formate/nitrite transporter n=1 Tax=Pluteus cervinus TaxID=181527 RepID=A0ACD3B3M4_9AGAR|nr:putative formate/nitrite transporter [Pluteus cervinus]
MASESTLKPAEVAQYFVQAGINKHKDRYENIFAKAFLAGVMLSFGGLLSEIVNGGSAGLTSSNPGLVKLLSGFVFPVGLVMILLQGLELLTSNMMIFPMALVKRVIPWWSLPLNWLIVFWGNLAGSLFFAGILVKFTGLVSVEPYLSGIQTFAIHKAGEPQWHQIFLRGIGCNWLVCVAVWQAAGAKETVSKIFAIWIPIWIFVACGYDHVIANMFSVPLGIMLGADLTTVEYIRKSLIASFLGNVVGALFVGLPACYFYLRDHTAGGLRDAENGSYHSNDEGSTVKDK